MSKYTTGELAKLCSVSVRTVQYYDNIGILVPSELSEGGRRLYSENDLRKMRVICYLREMDVPIKTIGKLIKESDPEKIASVLINEHEKELKKEIDERQKQIDMLENLKNALKQTEITSFESLKDIADNMESRKKLRKVRALILTVGIFTELVEIGTAVLWALTGIWLPFAIGMVLVVLASIWISVYYYRKVNYICPECNNVFRPTPKQVFWAPHTPTTRKLKCPICSHKGYCVETYNTEE